jgi:hypothetical protein
VVGAMQNTAYAAREGDHAAAWRSRLRRDALAARRQTDELRRITSDVLAAAVDAGVSSFAVTGSTALNRRTPVSDVDFYVVGGRPDLPDSDQELDVYAIDVGQFERRLDSGDDYLHWTLRFGLILHDRGPFRWAFQRVAREHLWPDPEPKWRQACRAAERASAILRTGDHDAAMEQCRIAFSLTARWWLLQCGAFPRARADLPEQLSQTAFSWLADVLQRTIFAAPSPVELADALQRLQRALDSRGAIS